MTDEKNRAAEKSARPEPEQSRGKLAEVAASLVDAAAPVLAAARRAVDERPGARVRRVRRLGRQSLPNLWEEHPEAQRATIRELGLRSVPVEHIRGTGVAGPAQRGGDFLPLRNRRGDDWQTRWRRIREAIDRLEPLPPVELIKFGDGYWVVDGHNRVAAALYVSQGEIDAVVQELRLPGMAAEPKTPIAGVLEGSLDLRAAGQGRLTRTADRPLDLESARPHEHADDHTEE
ncbi:MAG TPA: hypothetical protein VM284_04015 [Candidatus Limnocylindria bacterium]|nr:hypothetical protein [Candidatus Limnocylindria bacterium]